MAIMQRVPLADVNQMAPDAFVAHLGGVFEHSPWIAAQAAMLRPYRDWADLYETLCRVVDHLSDEATMALLTAHPDLVGRAALLGTLTPQSTQEQAAAGLDVLSPVDVAQFTALNAAYRDRFGFPFIICARENRKESILAGFAERLLHDRTDEIATALGEIRKIAWFRLRDIVE